MSSYQQQQEGSAATPCAAGCGFFGSPGTLDLCSVCYKKHCAVSCIAEPGANSVAAVTGTAASSTAATDVESFAPSSSAPGAAKKPQPTRCAACCKKVGLTGFVCRCKKTFCGTHRYAEEHGCSFDFKAAGRDAVARSNPLVKAEKLAVKI